MGSCVGTILSVLKEPVITHWAYVIKYKDLVQKLEQENRRLREKKGRIQRLVDTANRNGRFIELEVSNWLEEVEQMERDIANFLRRQENGEQMERDFANFLRQQENGEQMERDFANFLRQQENGEQMERVIANFLRQQENGEQMKRNFANLVRQQGESFKCFLGCMCPNLMWRHKMGKEADERNRGVIALIDRARDLPESVELSTPFQWEPHFDSSQYYTTFPSRASVFDKIMEALKDSVADMIGVHGPGGAGKTTMVKEVAKEAKKLEIFNTIVIAVVSKDPNTFKLQEDIAPQLDLKYEQKSELGRADELRKALLNGKRKILVILDDLWQVLDLKAIGIPISGLGDRGCKILLTSRNEEVFNRMEVRSCFPIGYLEEQETWKLFTKVTGDFGVDESKARKVCKRCGGLPIAIVTVGAALRGKEELEWENALHQLENCPLKHIEGIRPKDYTPLKWSYDFLEEKDAKSCFLLCCLFPEDAEISIDDLVKYSFALGFLRKVDTLKAAGYRVQAMVNMLRRSCLLLNGKNENFVKMHDVIRDLAISITEEKQTEHGSGHDWPGQQQFMVDHNIRKWPRNDAWKHHTAISLRSNVDNFTFSVLDCPQVHTLVLELGNNSDLEIPNDFFKGMKGARVLDLIGMSLELPSSSVWELDNLRMLCLKYCELPGDLSRIQNLKNHLQILSIGYDELFELPREIGELTSLQSLDLINCSYLTRIPKGVISNLIHLKELYVGRSFESWDVTIDGVSNASIVELKSLTQLSVLHVGMSTESSRIMVRECHVLFEKLISFAIYMNRNKFYPSERSLQNVLEISNSPRIDEKFHLLMNKVDKLMLSGIQDLRYLDGKPQLQHTSSGGGSFCKLTYLDIVECDNMKYLFSPSCAKAFQQLKELSVSNCGRMEQIIGVGDHYNEEEADIQDLRYSDGKPQSQFTPSGGGSLCKLTHLSIKGCGSMKYLFSSSYAKVFQQLKALFVRDCGRMEQIIGVDDHYNEGEVGIDEVIIFNQLRVINLEGLSQFRCFCPEVKKTINEGNSSNSAESIFNEKVSFPVLEILTINESLFTHQLPVKNIWKKETIQSSCGNEVSFSQLKEVTINKCHNLINVFPSSMFSRLQNLEILSVSMCHSLTLLVEDSNSNIRPTDNFKFVVFPKLRNLKLSSLPKLMRIWPDDEEYCSYDNPVHLYLKFISIWECGSLRHVFSAFVARHLACIERLIVRRCSRMEVIVSEVRGAVTDDIIKFSQLKSLELCDLSNLKSFYQFKSEASHLFNHQVSFPVLDELVIEELPVENLNLNIQSSAIKSKFNDVFPKLRDLQLNYLPKLMKTWFNDEDYCSCDDYVNLYLKSISITGCSSLKHTFSAFASRQLACIERLRVEECPEMEMIVSETRERVIDDGIIEFCQLKKLHLMDLPNLKSFYQSKSKVSYLFNDQVIFPKIESLFLRDLNRSREIQLWNLLATTQEHLHELSIIGCQVLTEVSSHHQKRSFRTINNLSLQNCQGFKHVIDLNGTISIGEEPFGDMKILYLNDLPELVPQWNKNLYKIGGFRNLKCICIEKCPQLRSLFTQFMATTLQHLEMLSVRSCVMMEEIIIIEENNINFAGKVKATRHIEFPQLRMVILVDLPNLKNFCNNESGSFSFSSLRKVIVKDCPKMKTFASGQIYLPSGKIKTWVSVTDGTEKCWLDLQEFTDLNACIELRSKDDPTIYCGDTYTGTNFSKMRKLCSSDWETEELQMMMIYDDVDF